MMKYTIKIHIKQGANDVSFLGEHKLSDEYTYNYYDDLVKNNPQFWLQFDSVIRGQPYGFVLIDNEITHFEDEYEDLKCLVLVVKTLSKCAFLTDEQYNNQKLMKGLVENLDKKRIEELINHNT